MKQCSSLCLRYKNKNKKMARKRIIIEQKLKIDHKCILNRIATLRNTIDKWSSIFFAAFLAKEVMLCVWMNTYSRFHVKKASMFKLFDFSIGILFQ